MGLFDLFKRKKLTNDSPVNRVTEIYKDYPEIPYVSPDRDMESWLEMVSLFNNIVPKDNMNRLPENLLPGHILLLWKVNFNNFTNITPIPSYFEYQYGIDGQTEIQNLVIKHYISVSSASNSLKYMTIAQLKEILQEKNIKAKRLKDEIILQVRENWTDQQLENKLHIRGYELTSKGKEILKKYQNIVDKHTNKNKNTTLSDALDDSPKSNKKANSFEPDYYRILGTLDKNTCESCGKMDGKIFSVAEKKVGINYPPFHDGCRCTTVPHSPDYPESNSRWFRDPKTGKGEIGPYMTYSEWKEKYMK